MTIDEDGVLYRVVHRHGREIRQLVLPSVLKNRVLSSLHDECGHQGVERTFELVRSRCFWPSYSRMSPTTERNVRDADSPRNNFLN